MLPCICSVIDHRRRQNVVRTSVTYSPAAPVPLFCSYHILTSSAVYNWTDTRQNGIYLLSRSQHFDCILLVYIRQSSTGYSLPYNDIIIVSKYIHTLFDGVWWWWWWWCSLLLFFLAPAGLGKIVRNSQNIRAYYMLNHRIRDLLFHHSSIF